jgi:hypothetical protein
MGRPKKIEEGVVEGAKKDFNYTPFVDSDSLPAPKIDKKGEFVSYGDPHYAYRMNTSGNVEFIAIYKKPKGVVTKLHRVLKVKKGKNADDAFFRLIKNNNIPEID